MSYYKEAQNTGKIFARLIAGGSRPAKAGSSQSSAPKQKKAKKDKKAKKAKYDKGKAVVVGEAPLIELSDTEAHLSDVPVAPITAPPPSYPSYGSGFGSGSGSGYN